MERRKKTKKKVSWEYLTKLEKDVTWSVPHLQINKADFVQRRMEKKLPASEAAGVCGSHYKPRACFTAIVTCHIDKLNYGKKNPLTEPMISKIRQSLFT